MAANVAHDDFIKNMDKLEKALAKTAGAKPAALGAEDLCKTYHKIKPTIEFLLPFLEPIPVVGKIVPAIRVLMRIADSFCSAP